MTRHLISRRLILGSAAAVPALCLPLAAPTAPTPGSLRMGVGAEVTSLDPEYHNISPNNAFASMVFDALVATDGQSRLLPGLALSWAPMADDVW